MKINKIFFLVFLLLSFFLVNGCQKYSTFETEEYSFQYPLYDENKTDIKTDSSYSFETSTNSKYSVSIITKVVTNNNSLIDCLEEILGSDSYKELTFRVINGKDAVVVKGEKKINNRRISWMASVILYNNKFYFIEVSSENTFMKLNRLENSKIISSFKFQ